MGIVGLVNLGHGGWEQIETCAYIQHDIIGAVVFAIHLSEKDLLLADRAFCSYELIARCRKQSASSAPSPHFSRLPNSRDSL